MIKAEIGADASEARLGGYSATGARPVSISDQSAVHARTTFLSAVVAFAQGPFAQSLSAVHFFLQAVTAAESVTSASFRAVRPG